MGGTQTAKAILAVDLGTSGCKAALVDRSGAVLGWAYEPVELHILPEHGAEQNPEDWWRALVTSTRRLLAETGTSPTDVAAVACSTQGECTVPVDAEGNALMNAVLWMDMRGEDAVRRRAGGAIRVAGYGATKLLRWIRLTGGAPALSGKDPAGHMLFIKEAFPDIYRRTYKFLNALDYMNLRLTGRFTATPDSILTSWVTDNRKPDRIAYHPSLLKQSGIDPDKFPELVRCTDVLGPLQPAAAQELGLSPQTVVVAGAIDTTAAAVGSGAVGDYEPHLYIGTSSWIAAHVPFKKTDVASGIASVPCALSDRYLLIATQTSAGGNLTYLKERILYHQDELLQDENVPDVYKILDRIAERTPAGSRGLLYTPWLYGERCPVDEGTLRAGLFNLSLEHSREDVIRAFLEGVALNTRWMLKPVERFLGRPVRSINIAGGGGVSRVWCRIFADVLGVTIRQLKEPVQANAVGAAWIARVGLGEMSFADVAGRTDIREEFVPDADNAPVYNQAFQNFQEIHRRLGPLYRKINAPERTKTMKHANNPSIDISKFDAVRREVVAACLRLADMGYLAGIGGNMAVRAGQGCFAVTPSAADYYNLTPEDICILRLDNLEKIAGDMQPSVESGLHAALLNRRPDLNASIHTHQPVASGVALLAVPLPVEDPEARQALGDTIVLTPYAPSGTTWLAKSFAKVLRDDVNGYLLRNHGVVCGGPDLEQAIRNVGYIESESARFLREEIIRARGADAADNATRRALEAVS